MRDLTISANVVGYTKQEKEALDREIMKLLIKQRREEREAAKAPKNPNQDHK